MSPPRGRDQSQKRSRSVEGLLETVAERDGRAPRAKGPQMKKAKSLEEYLEARDDDDDGAGSVSASVGDVTKKRNFVDKCISKMKSLVTAAKRTPDAD